MATSSSLGLEFKPVSTEEWVYGGTIMRNTFFFLSLTLLMTVACAHQGQRDPASVKQEQNTSHEKHQGLFDKI
jgi:hypothetical protein